MDCVTIFFASSGSLFFLNLDCLAVSKCDSVPFIVGWDLLNGLLILNSYQMLRFPCHLFNAFLSFSFPLYFYFPLSFTLFSPSFCKSATYKECELPSAQTKQRLDQMWPAICWMGNKHEECSPSAICWCRKQQGMPGISTGLPHWEIEREKAFVSFFPFSDLTAPLSKLGRRGGHLAMKKWQLTWKHLNRINKLYFCIKSSVLATGASSKWYWASNLYSHQECSRVTESPLPKF